jgi:signal transduction histidine kinase
VTDDRISGDGFEFSLTDEGQGIPEGELEHIFEHFQQSSATKSGAGGTGLGLSIAKQIVDAHKGKIWAENSDKGARFVILLPKDPDLIKDETNQLNQKQAA